jgi:hypothetical protein
MISLPLSLYFTLASTDAFNLSGLLKFTIITYISVNHLVHQSYKNLTVIVLFVCGLRGTSESKAIRTCLIFVESRIW